MNINNLRRFNVLPRNSNVVVNVTRIDADNLQMQKEGEDRKDSIRQDDLFRLLGDGWSILNVVELVEEPTDGVSVAVSLDGVDETLSALDRIVEAGKRATEALKAVTAQSVIACAAAEVMREHYPKVAAAGGLIKADTVNVMLGEVGTEEVRPAPEYTLTCGGEPVVPPEKFCLSAGYNASKGKFEINAIEPVIMNVDLGEGEDKSVLAHTFRLISCAPAHLAVQVIVSNVDVALLDAAQEVRAGRHTYTRKALGDNWTPNYSNHGFTAAEVSERLKGETVYVTMFPLENYRGYLTHKLQGARKERDYADRCVIEWKEEFKRHADTVESVRNTLAAL